MREHNIHAMDESTTCLREKCFFYRFSRHNNLFWYPVAGLNKYVSSRKWANRHCGSFVLRRKPVLYSTILTIILCCLLIQSTFSTISDIPIKQELKPDHGENFVPGSETAPDHMAPQPLDHFKRGYKERADLRDRETNQLANEFEGGQPEQSPPLQPPPVPKAPPVEEYPREMQHREMPNREIHQRETRYREPHRRDSHHREPPRRDSYRHNLRNNEFRRSSTGFDATRVVDDLCTPGCNLVDIMDRAKESFYASFQSGKALTAILSNLARRRKMGVALSVWQWMDQRDVTKNVFHYNSLISVCEKTKDHKMALQLLGEMERRGIKKNEVT